MAEAERNVGLIQDPRTYYQWLRILQGESRALDFEEKWKDSLRSVNPPERMGNPAQFQDERWLDTLAAHPDVDSDVWAQVRDWEEFQKYIQAAVSIFESPLYEGRAAMSKWSNKLDRAAKSLHKAGFENEAHRLCRLRDLVARRHRYADDEGDDEDDLSDFETEQYMPPRFREVDEKIVDEVPPVNRDLYPDPNKEKSLYESLLKTYYLSLLSKDPESPHVPKHFKEWAAEEARKMMEKKEKEEREVEMPSDDAPAAPSHPWDDE